MYKFPGDFNAHQIILIVLKKKLCSQLKLLDRYFDSMLKISSLAKSSTLKAINKSRENQFRDNKQYC